MPHVSRRILVAGAALLATALGLASAATGQDADAVATRGGRDGASVSAPRTARFTVGAAGPVPATALGQTVVGHDLSAWPGTSYGALRLWDVGTTWRDLEPRRGVFSWGRLDARVAGARSRGKPALLVLGMTPQWASSRPSEPAIFGPGAAAPPARTADWEGYVRAVVTRYRGKVEAYELWNEVNLPSMWTGGPTVLADLSRRAAAIIASVDPAARVVSPTVALRYDGVDQFLTTFVRAGGLTRVGVVGVHAYPEHGKGPEEMYALLRHVRSVLGGLHVALPVWNTEINYGLATATNGRPRIVFTGAVGAAYTIRTALLNYAAGSERVYWYAWNDVTWGGTPMLDSRNRPTPAAVGYSQVYAWMVGHHFVGCTTTAPVWTCRFTDGRTELVAMWTTSGTYGYRVPAGITSARLADGRTVGVRPGTTITLSVLPLLLVRP